MLAYDTQSGFVVEVIASCVGDHKGYVLATMANGKTKALRVSQLLSLTR